MPPLALQVSQHVANEAIAVAIFVVSYVLISARRLPFVRLNRPAAALLGAVMMVLFTDVTFEDATRTLVSWETIALLLGMMLIVAYLRISYFFEWIAYHLLRAASRPARLVTLLVFGCGILSAIFVNDTICLMFTPIVLLVVARSGRNPAPYLLAVATGSNAGSVMTLTGNPQNMLVGLELVKLPGWSYAKFALLMAPIGFLSLAACAAVIIWTYRDDLAHEPAVEGPAVHPPRVRFLLMRKSTVVLAGVLVAFLVAPRSMPLSALTGGTALIAWSRRKPERALALVDWTLLLFFAALFVIVRGVDRAGIVDDVHGLIAPVLSGSAGREIGVFSVVTSVLSNIVSNVPYVLVAGKWIASFERPGLGWFTMAMASTLAGNLTIFGSVANMIVLELSREKVRIGFWEYCRVGVPITVVTTALGVGVCMAYWALGIR